jgi:hypothetical protein
MSDNFHDAARGNAKNRHFTPRNDPQSSQIPSDRLTPLTVAGPPLF